MFISFLRFQPFYHTKVQPSSLPRMSRTTTKDAGRIFFLHPGILVLYFLSYLAAIRCPFSYLVLSVSFFPVSFFPVSFFSVSSGSRSSTISSTPSSTPSSLHLLRYHLYHLYYFHSRSAPTLLLHTLISAAFFSIVSLYNLPFVYFSSAIKYYLSSVISAFFENIYKIRMLLILVFFYISTVSQLSHHFCMLQGALPDLRSVLSDVFPHRYLPLFYVPMSV